jgi:dihydrofolate synthase/folylpolyglutamate synthase
VQPPPLGAAFPDDPIDFLFSLERFGMKFGLENISRLCDALGHPEHAFRSVLIAGTNGKGSVTVMVETALRSARLRAARYTSPHLVRLEERFVIQGKEVTRAQLRAAAGRIRAAVVRLLDDGSLDAPPTFFECTTAAAFDLFREANVDMAVLEVGLGGRLDATNVVTPLVAAITSIDFDHQQQLGYSIESIAREKAGIIKPGVAVVCGPLPGEAERVIREACVANGSRLVRAEERVQVTLRRDGAVDVRIGDRMLPGITLALAGGHQRQNAAVAVAVIDELSRLDVQVPDEAIREALTTVQWPGRIERFRLGGIDIILDAAHNPAGAAALAAYLSDSGWRDATLVLGVMRDKDVRGMIEALLRPPDVWGLLVCTTAPGARALSAAELTAVALEVSGGRVAIETVPDPGGALERAERRGRPAVAAGSIFLIGPLRDIVR